MPDLLPKFDNPPVVETVLSAQFARMPKYRTSHAGCFWKEYLSKEGKWTTIEEVPRIDDQFERFGDDIRWGPSSGLRFFTTPEPYRTQITRDDRARMIQVQDSRFIYNWKKGNDPKYPSYDTTKLEFEQNYGHFTDFVAKSELGTIEENQWEVTYVNHLPKGELWESRDDWKMIFPWFAFPENRYSSPDYMVCEWHSIMPGNAGRLHINLSCGRVSDGGPDTLILTLVARGPASSKSNIPVAKGLDIGHEIIVRSFTAMTSQRAHEHWRRTI